MLKQLVFIFLLLIYHSTKAQKIIELNSNTSSSFRGLSVVNDDIIWISGSQGKVLKSINGGQSFNTYTVKGFEKMDFRDIEAFDSLQAIIISISEPAFVLKTFDGGKNWKIVFTDSAKGMFLDALCFYNNKYGLIVGDPIINNPFLISSNDEGDSWKKVDNELRIDTGEALFASSGSNICLLNKNDYLFVTGGKESRIVSNNKKYNNIKLPINKGFESTGANSISVFRNKAIIVGGDFTKDSLRDGNCILFNLKTKKFTNPSVNPFGYRSCVIHYSKNLVFTCGINGIDKSEDGGLHWQSISKKGFHVMAKAKKGKNIFMAGSKGRIAKMTL